MQKEGIVRKHTKGRVFAEPVCDGLCCHRDCGLLLYPIWEELIIPHVSVCVCASAALIQNRIKTASKLCVAIRGVVLHSQGLFRAPLSKLLSSFSLL